MSEDQAPRRPTKWVVAVIGLFLLAVLLGRLLIAGGSAWVALLLVVPLLLFAFSAAVSFRFALVATGMFVTLVLLVRWILQANPLGWIVLALLPVIALTAVLVGRVLGAMRSEKLSELSSSEESR